MIQLTKGTNVLDINLSDYSGAGQDVVQNGSFDDIGSDLVQNGDFAEIGSELVTNGDFSAVPLGSELVDNNDFSNGTTDWSADGGSTITVGTHEGRTNVADINITGTGTNNRISQAFSWTKNSSYKVTCDVFVVSGSFRIDTADSLYDGDFVSTDVLGSWQTLTGYITSNTTGSQDFWLRSMLDGAVGEVSEFYVDSVSIKEETNLVTNPNFTDTGSELLTAFSNGTVYPFTTFVTSGNDISSAIVTSNYAAAVSNSIALTIGESYIVTFTYTKNSGDDLKVKFSDATGAGVSYSNAEIITESGTYSKYFTITTTTTGYLQMGTSGSGSLDISLTDVSIKKLGEDWTAYTSGTSTVEYNSSGANLLIDSAANGGSNVGVYQENIFELGKSYKIVLSMKATASFDAEVVESNLAATENVIGTVSLTTSFQDFTFYYVGTGTFDLFIHRLYNGGGASQTISIQSVVVQELGEDWTVIENGGGSVTFGGSFAEIIKTSSTPTFLQQDYAVTLGASHKLTYTVTENTLPSSADELALSSGSAYGYSELDASASATPKTVYLTVTDETPTAALRLFSRGASGSIKITDISVQEVGQDWTLGTGWSIGDSKAVFDDTQTNYIAQNSPSFAIGNSYKVTFEIQDCASTCNVTFYNRSHSVIFVANENWTNGTYTRYFTPTVNSEGFAIWGNIALDSFSITNITVQQLDTNNRWVTFADPDSKSVMKQGQVDLEIDSSGNNCGVYQTGLIKPNKLYIITINMKATAAINVEIAASLGTAVSAVIGTETLTTSYKEYSFEYVTPFAVDHDLQIHRLFGSGASQTISIDYVSMNGVDESQWTNDPTWDPFATSLVFVPTLTDESTNNSKQFTLDTSITDGGWDGRSLHGQVIINEFPTEIPASGIINLKQPDFLEGFYQVEIRGYLGTFYRVLGKCMAHLERASTEDGYNRFESYNDTVTYKAYEE